MSKKNILVVEDNKEMRKLIKIVLEKNFGYEVLDLPNGAAAVRLLITEKPDITAAVLDIMMMAHGGVIRDYLTKESKYKYIPIIYHTALSKEQIDERILEGALYIHKESGSIKKVGVVLEDILS